MAEQQIIDLGIVGIKNMGEYDSETAYEKLNVVTYEGSTYCALKNTVGNVPTNTEYWQLYAQKGETGSQGPKPVKGEDYFTEEDITDIENELKPVISTDVTEEVTSQLGSLVTATPLVASSTADMTDTTRIYVNTTDGHWYWYDGSDWTDGGIYQSTGIADNSITNSMLKDKIITDNKLEIALQDLITVGKKDVYFVREDNSYYNRNTHEKASTSTMCSTIIDVEEGEIYYLTIDATITSNICAVMFFDDNDNYLSYVQNSPYSWNLQEVIIPANAKKMGVSSTENSGIIIKKKSITIKPEVNEKITIEDISKKILNNQNYKITLLGDSITAGAGGTGYSATGADIITISGTTYKRNETGYCWANLMKKYLENKFNNVSVINNGISGMRSNLISSPEYVRLPYLISNDTNLVIVAFGTNDRGSNTQDETYQFLTPVIEYCRANNKQILFLTPIPGSIGQDSNYNYHFEDLSNVIKKLCINYEVPFIDMFTEFKNYCLYNNIDMDTLRVDSLHPNDTGYKIMFELIMKNLLISTPQSGETWIDLDHI